MNKRITLFVIFMVFIVSSLAEEEAFASKEHLRFNNIKQSKNSQISLNADRNFNVGTGQWLLLDRAGS